MAADPCPRKLRLGDPGWGHMPPAIAVFLDGVQVKNLIGYNCDDGTVELWTFDNHGAPIMTREIDEHGEPIEGGASEPVTQTLTGQVDARWV